MLNKFLSIVLPVYKTSEFILELYRQLSDSLAGVCLDYELIFVDDGSPDDAWEILKSLSELDNKVKAFKLATNYGQHAAVATGLSKASGDLAIVMDADLQDSPYEIPRLLACYEEGNEIVVSVRTTTTGSLLRRAGTYFVRKVCKIYSRLPNKFYYGSFSLLSRAVLDNYLKQPDRFYYFLKVIDRIPCEIGFVRYRQSNPNNVRSSYTIAKLIRLFSLLVSTRELERSSNICSGLSVLASVATIFVALSVASSDHPIVSPIYIALVLTLLFYIGAIVSGVLLKTKTSDRVISDTRIVDSLNYRLVKSKNLAVKPK